MGGLTTKGEIIARLDELDREEIDINKQLRDIQIELNGLVEAKERVKVKSEYFENVNGKDILKAQKKRRGDNSEMDDDDEYDDGDDGEEEGEEGDESEENGQKKTRKKRK